GIAAGVWEISGDRWRVHLEIHPQRVRLQRAGEYTDHVSDRLAQFENSRLCHSRERAELSWIHRVSRDVQRGGALLPTAGRRFGRDRWAERLGVPHRSRRNLQPDDPLAISAMESRTVGRFQLAV